MPLTLTYDPGPNPKNIPIPHLYSAFRNSSVYLVQRCTLYGNATQYGVIQLHTATTVYPYPQKRHVRTSEVPPTDGQHSTQL